MDLTYDAGFIAAKCADARTFGWHREIGQGPLRLYIVAQEAHFV